MNDEHIIAQSWEQKYRRQVAASDSLSASYRDDISKERSRLNKIQLGNMLWKGIALVSLAANYYLIFHK